MFNNILYFIVVLLIYNIGYPESRPETSFWNSAGMMILFWGLFALYSRALCRRLERRYADGPEGGHLLVRDYHGLMLRLSILAIVLFTVDVYLFQLKYWIHRLPGARQASVVEGGLAVSVFLFYLATVWYLSYPLYKAAFQADLSRRSYIISNLKFNIPILFPWLSLSFVYDLLTFTPLAGPDGFFNKPEGQILFFASFLIVLMIFMPWLIQTWWGCRPFEPSRKISELERFLREKGFRYRALLKWPIFEGRLMTAGIMGIVARYRYILITETLMENLTTEEIKAVVAHEMGHAKHRHLLFYLVFFLGFMVVSLGLFEILFYFLASQPLFISAVEKSEAEASNLFYLLMSVPMLLIMIVYFRYIMGFFMRHFERQADLYSAVVMNTPVYTISSLEKIAFLSGRIRDLPSWHHFSIRERVEYLWRVLREPLLIRKQNRFVAAAFAVYLVCIAGLGYALNFSSIKNDLAYGMIARGLNQRIEQAPDNITLYLNLAMVYHRTEDYEKAVETYERILRIDPDQDMALNNLAWLLATARDERLRDTSRAVRLAERAVSVKKSSIYFDTLAEAYFVSGRIDQAVEAIQEAIRIAEGDIGYYKQQLKRFKTARRQGGAAASME